KDAPELDRLRQAEAVGGEAEPRRRQRRACRVETMDRTGLAAGKGGIDEDCSVDVSELIEERRRFAVLFDQADLLGETAMQPCGHDASEGVVAPIGIADADHHEPGHWTSRSVRAAQSLPR